jgi:hypothetical protein
MRSEVEPIDTVTDATVGGGDPVTVTVLLALADPDVARMVAVPLATPVTKPFVDTVAIAAFVDDQTIGAPTSTLAAASFAAAVAWVVLPTARLVWGTVSRTVAAVPAVTVTRVLSLGFHQLLATA